MDTPAIPVMRPRLPDADALLPYLRRIDQTRLYSNMGPLACELAARLQDRFNAPAHPVANATLGLAATLMAFGLPAGSLCMVPAWTFAASAHAILLAGLVPFLVDVDEASGMLGPDMAADYCARAPAPVGAVMPVSAFGRPVDMSGWQDFHRRHQIAVAVDAAAGFDTAMGGDVPVVVSLHATKVLGAGEGAFILCRDTQFLRRCAAITTFGFSGDRHAQMAGMNAKLSEYHAATTLAALDQWPQNRREILALTARLADMLPQPMGWRAELTRPFAANTVNLEFPGGWQAAERRFTAAAIETRRWWGPGLHRHAAFAHCPQLPTPETDRRAAQTLGLPFHCDLDGEAVERIAAAARASLDPAP